MHEALLIFLGTGADRLAVLGPGGAAGGVLECSACFAAPPAHPADR